jgi:hypothetical protein
LPSQERYDRIFLYFIFLSMPNKFLVETALDVGIDNLKKLRMTDPKALYDEVKSAI